jgi:hypothetical protein
MEPNRSKHNRLWGLVEEILLVWGGTGDKGMAAEEGRLANGLKWTESLTLTSTLLSAETEI